MTIATWFSLAGIIGGLLAMVARGRAARSKVAAARSAVEASGEVLYRQLQADYQTTEMRDALEAIKQGKAKSDDYLLVSHFFRAATDLLAVRAIEGELADNIKTLQGRYLMKHNVIPWEQQHRAQRDHSAVEFKALNERFLREFNIT